MYHYDFDVDFPKHRKKDEMFTFTRVSHTYIFIALLLEDQVKLGEFKKRQTNKRCLCIQTYRENNGISKKVLFDLN